MTKPPNPRKVGNVHGRKPRAPKPHSNSGSSSTGSRTMAWVAVAVFAPGLVAFVASVAWLIGERAA